jgi:hypothetical protein
MNIAWWEPINSQALEYDKWCHAGGAALCCCVLFAIRNAYWRIRFFFVMNSAAPFSRVFSTLARRRQEHIDAWRIGAVILIGSVLYELYQGAISIPDVLAGAIGIMLFIGAVYR